MSDKKIDEKEKDRLRTIKVQEMLDCEIEKGKVSREYQRAEMNYEIEERKLKEERIANDPELLRKRVLEMERKMDRIDHALSSLTRSHTSGRDWGFTCFAIGVGILTVIGSISVCYIVGKLFFG